MKLKELLDIAIIELRELTSLQNPDFRLEQAVYKDGPEVYEIIVSYLVENTNRPIKIFPVASLEYNFLRLYKRLLINKDKEVVGMYIHDNKE